MKRYLGTLLFTLAAAACSTNKPAENADDSSQAAANDPLLEGASSETVAAADASHVGVEHHATGADSSASATGASATSGSATNASTSTTSSNASSGGTTPPATQTTPAPQSQSTTNAPSATAAQPGTSPDNTKVNKRDANASALTPMDQGNNRTDLDITQQIRQAVMADGSLSFNAKNVKIITVKGKVTLRGPVKSEQERAAIESAAKKVAGDANVENQIEVKK
jgi:osmotically-inducible protein OsmY